MPTNIHILMTYKCTLRCDHCFVFGSPKAEGIITSYHINALLDEAVKIGDVRWIYFEGGEPFLLYPLLLKSIHKANRMGFQVGVVTNGYFARSEETAIRYLKPLKNLGLARLCISDDQFHYKTRDSTPAKRALRAAFQIDLPTFQVSTCLPGKVEVDSFIPEYPASKLVLRLKLIGNACGNFSEQLPISDWEGFTICPDENIQKLDRISIDPFGYVFVCQGLAIGNAWETPLSEILQKHDGMAHPLLGPLLSGGPALLRRTFQPAIDDPFVDACHLCYTVRRALIKQFPEYLAPNQVYGLKGLSHL